MPRTPTRRGITLVSAVSAGVLVAGSMLAAGQLSASAAESSPVGFAGLNGGTKGGASGTVVTVNSASALKSALTSSTSQTVKVSGMITISGMYSVASNKTVLGSGASSGITGGGLNLSGVQNVIIRNLVFKNASDDSINPVHVLNNYYSNIGSYGVGSAMNAGVFVERNYFENVAKPTIATVAESDPGNLKVLNNYKVNSGTEQVRNGASVAAIPYAYTPEAAASVKATVKAGAGTGKL